MADGLTPEGNFSDRVETAVAGNPITSNTMNEIQDRSIAVSAQADTIAAAMFLSKTATLNQSDSPAPDTMGGRLVWFEATTNGITEVVVDTAMDYRGRFALLAGQRGADADHVPGGADDDQIWSILSPSGAPATHFFAFVFFQDGNSAPTSSPYPGVTFISIVGGTDYVVWYARPSDGALCIIKNAASDTDVTLMGALIVSPPQNH